VKVIGTGVPEMLTIRFELRELELLRAELLRQRAVWTARERKRAPSAEEELQEMLHDGRPRHRAMAARAEEPASELEQFSAVLEQIDAAYGQRGESVEILGPTWLLVPVVRGASREAFDRLSDALTRFADPRTYCTLRELQSAIAAAHAWMDTLAGCDYVENHGLVECQGLGD
jgi:hypothetical protein